MSKAQDRPLAPKLVGTGVFLGETPPLRNLPAVTLEEIAFLKEKALKKAARKVIKQRKYPFAETALPKTEDAVWQKAMGKASVLRAPLVNFEGQTTSSFPPDCNGTIGPNHYMQTVNSTYAIYNRTGTLIAGPTNMNLLFNGVSGATCNDGDPLIQYDEQAQRWIAVEFSLCGANDLMLVAVSSTNDPTGTWYAYSFDVADMPDYEKIGIWQDGYYMGTNTGSGNDTYVFERSKMLIGAANPQMVAFDNSWRPGSGFLCVPPLDNDGAFAPAGSPGLFIAFNDDAVAGGSDQLWIYELAVNWTTPANSTFVRSQQIAVTAFDSQFNANWDDITQPGTQKLDGVPQVIMNAPQYRNFGDYQTIVCCHTVDVDATNHAGIRWYELRKTSTNPWTIRQSGTYAPDASSRWMGSIMLNGSGKIGLAYSIASSSIYPGIRYCGQSSSAYTNASGVLDIPEEIIHNGTVAQTTYNRWGDYSLLSVDPTDDETFWYSTEYVKSGGTLKGTKIASFRFGNNPQVSTLAATSVAPTTATLNGTVNPNSLATNYYFQWGTTVSYGYTTSSTSAGTGTSNVAVSSNIAGLIAGTTYHFRLVAINNDGTTYGNDFTFLPGAASITTNSISSITTSSASSGGNVINDGGLSVTVRGVCWNTSSNPTTANSKTTDGGGIGTFTSSILGLAANTTYYVRAYATNSAGTFYGNELSFTTLSNLPTLTTTAISSISLNSASSGGNITNQGISAVTARGVCWSTSINPTTANSITTNGSGLGAFSSSITGLTSNTTYHVRAYASNSLGTSYGNDIAFTTLCGIFTLPFTENFPFSNPTLPNCWTIVDNQGNGQVWKIGTITDQSTNPNLNSLYAYLNSDSLGSGNSQNTDIITPTLNLSAFTSVTLQFNYYFKSYTGSSGNLYYSINNGNTWTLITSITTTSTLNPTAFNQTISAVAGQSAVKFKWNYTATWGYFWAIDDIIILGTPLCTLPSAATAISGTANVCQGQNNVVYSTATIANATSYIWTLPTGATGASSTTSITVNYGTSAISGNITVKGNNTCGNGTSSSLAISLNSLPSAAGTISGTTTVCQGQNYVVYTIPAIANATSYIWILPSGATGTSSTNSITVNYGTSAISGNITVKGNNICGDGASSSLSITVNPLPGTAGVISGITSVCQGQNNIVYTVPAINNATSYLWSLPTGASGTITSNSINVNFSQNAISGNIFVYGNNNCGVGSSSLLAITVNSLADTASTISGTTTVCQGQNNVVYTVPTITNATNYIWTLPLGATGTSTTNSITVNYGTSAISGNITVKGNNSCGDGVSSSLAITVNPLPGASGTISGNTTVCQGQDNVVYTVPAITNASSYSWTLPSGGTGTIVSNSIYVHFFPFAVSGDIVVRGSNSCGNGVSSLLAVTVNPLPGAAGTISGNTSICSGQNNILYTVPEIANATTYSWTLPSGATGTSSTNSIIVNFGASAISGNITVKGINDCGDGVSSALAVSVNQSVAAAGPITGSTIICSGQNNVVYTVAPITNATSYIWTLPVGASGSSNTNSISVNYATSAVSGTISVKAHSACGNGDSSALTITIIPRPTITGTIYDTHCGAGIVNLKAITTSGTINWYSSITGGSSIYTGANYSPMISQTTTFFVDVTNNGCTSYPRIAITGIIKTIPAIISTISDTVCPSDIVTLGATASLGTVNWYLDSLSSTPIAYGSSYSPSITSTTNYYVEAIENGCVSPTRTLITAVLVNSPVIIANATATNICEGIAVTLSGSGTAGVTYSWDNAVLNGIPFYPTETKTYTLTGTNFFGCQNTATVVVTVNPAPALNPISGTTTLCEGVLNSAYSVDLHTYGQPLPPTSGHGTDTTDQADGAAFTYAWSYSGVATIIPSTSINAINMNFSVGATSGILTVVETDPTSGCSRSNHLTITVNPLPMSSSSISGLNTICTGQNNIIYNIPVIANATNYVWTLPTGATGISDSNSITVNYSLSAISGNITVTGNNSCGDGNTSILAITVNPLTGSAGIISGNSIVCQGQSNVIYTIPAIANASSYIWTLPAGSTGISSTNSISVNYGNSAISGNISVKAHNSCGDGDSSTMAITVNTTPSDNPITGTQILCEGSLNSAYSVIIHTYGQPLPPTSGHGTDTTDQPDGAAFNYAWSYNGTAIINPSTTVNAINMNFPIGATSGILTVVETDPTTGCNKSNQLAITVNPLPLTPGAITGVNAVCQGPDFVNYTIPLIPNATSYNWTLPAGATGVSTSNSIDVIYGLSAISGVISVRGNNSCGDGVASSENIVVNPLPADAGVISGLATVMQGQNNVIYTVPEINAATSYVWTLPNGASGSSFTNTISVNYGLSSVSGDVSVKGINACGEGVASNMAVTVNHYQCIIRLKVNGSANAYTDETIVSFCNPSDQDGAEKMFSVIPTAPNIYSTKLNKNWSVNYLTTVTEHPLVPIGFIAGVNGNYTITASILSAFIPTAYIYLRDLNTKIVTELNDNTTYSYTATTNDSSHRFELIFSLQKLRWLGNYSTNWADITNWSNNTLPLASDDVILNSWTKNQPSVTMPISSPATCMNLIINPATNVTIEPGKALTVNGTLTNNAGNLGLIIKSDTTGTGSLLHTTANVVGTIERFINQPYADEFHMLATPVAAQPISPNFNETDGFYVWNEPNYSWVEYADSANFVLINGGTNFVPGKGYAVSYPSSQTKIFTGILNQGDITIPISYTIGMDAGWNFVGNPYPSPISWNANSGWNRNILENANVNEKAIWIWNAAVGNYGAYISNASIGTNSVSSNIPLAQGFWVKSASAGMLSMNDDVRIHANPAFLKQSTTNADMLRLKVKSVANAYSDEIIISFGNDNNLGGAEKIFSLDATAPGLFSTKLNKKWSINYLSSIAENALIPVGFKAGVDGNYTISALGVQSFGTVMLEDIKNNIQHNLSQDYSFDAQTTDNQNRFLLHFNSNGINENNSEKTPSIYYFNQTIAVYNPWAGKTMIAIYDINGKLIQSFDAKEGNGNYSFTSAQGVYIVKIVNDKHVFVKKEVVY